MQKKKKKIHTNFTYKTIMVKSVPFCPLQKKENCRHLFSENQKKQNANENQIYIVRLDAE